MSGMNEFLSQYYGTVNNEEQEKQAQVELFSKLAAENNIDLSQLTDGQVAELWDDFQKTAGDDEKDDDDKKDKKKDEKKEAAAYEYAEKRAAAEKLAEADFLGRVMAHSYVDEMKKIGGIEDMSAAAKANRQMDVHARGTGVETADQTMAHGLKRGGNVSGHGSGPSESARAHEKIFPKAKGFGEKALQFAKDHKGKIGLGLGAAALGGAAYAATRGGKKEKEDEGKTVHSSAIDELAADSAAVKAAEAGFDVNEAMDRLVAVLTLGPAESEKIAFAQTVDQAVEVRSLELLEMAGYPVTWNE